MLNKIVPISLALLYTIASILISKCLIQDLVNASTVLVTLMLLIQGSLLYLGIVYFAGVMRDYEE